MTRQRVPIAAIAGAVLAAVCSLPAASQSSYDTVSIARTVSEAAASMNAELTKATVVNKTVAEGIEAFRRSIKLQSDAADLQAIMKQPEGLCQTMEAQTALTTGALIGRARAAAAQRRVFASRGEGAAAALAATYAETGARFCSEDEERLKVCERSVDPRYAELAGADQDALYLFQGRSGGNTYEGGRDGPQVQAVDSYIRRVVVGVPAERLPTDRRGYASNAQARAYIELERRYRAFLSMSSYSLNQIKESRNPSQ